MRYDRRTNRLSNLDALALLGVFLIAASAAACIPGNDDEDEGLCGNGRKDPGEQCDDGNRIAHDGCSSDCRVEGFCGNSVVEPGEECDDGNYTAGDGCDPECQVETGCGDGKLEVGEECDDDNLQDGDGCSAVCLDEEPGTICGNGILEIGEGCDDGNNEPGDGCAPDCFREDGCGDGTVDASELCDDGNNISGDGCSADCLVEFVCGNDYCEEENFEDCEACPSDCCPDCGNLVLDEGEECDDGNNESGDGCSRGCNDEDNVATCGNLIWEAGEECEDGITEQYGCDESCQITWTCGDQQCDDALGEDCQTCQPDCCPNCGNGVRELVAGEECDRDELAGLTCLDFCYDGGTLGCTDWCTWDLSQCTGTGPVCGDGVAECEEQCDGNDLRNKNCASVGYASGTLGCNTNTCTLDLSGCTDLVWYLSEDFEDEAAVNSSWTLTGDWEVGIPSGISEEPPAAYGGTQVLGTNLGGDYSSSTSFLTNMAITPPIDLVASVDPRLVFFRSLGVYTYQSGANVWITNNGGVDWVLLNNPSVPYNDTEGGSDVWNGYQSDDIQWTEIQFDLSAFNGDTIQLGFALTSGSSVRSGMHVDDVLVTEANMIPVEVVVPQAPVRAAVDYPFDYGVTCRGGTGVYNYSIVGGTNHNWLTIDPVSGTLSGTPLAANLGSVTVDVKCEESTRTVNQDTQTLPINVFTAVYFENFEGSQPTGWTFTNNSTCNFEWGQPTVGPSAAYDGTYCVGTGMSTDHTDSSNFNTCVMDSATIDLSGTTNPFLSFWMWIDANGGFDGGNVKISTDGGSTWTLLTPQGGYDDQVNPASPPDEMAFTGNQSSQGWQEKIFDLATYAGQSNVKIRFAFGSTSGGSNPGWYIDSMTIAD